MVIRNFINIVNQQVDCSCKNVFAQATPNFLALNEPELGYRGHGSVCERMDEAGTDDPVPIVRLGQLTSSPLSGGEHPRAPVQEVTGCYYLLGYTICTWRIAYERRGVTHGQQELLNNHASHVLAGLGHAIGVCRRPGPCHQRGRRGAREHSVRPRAARGPCRQHHRRRAACRRQGPGGVRAA